MQRLNRIDSLIVLTLVLTTGRLFAQDSLKQSRNGSFISLSVGASFALGNYASSKSSSEGSGFAGSGFHYQLEFATFISRNTGFGVALGQFSNGINQVAFKNDFVLNMTQPNTEIKVTSDANPWKVGYALAGPYITLPMKNLSMDFKALGGLVFSHSPGFDYTNTVLGYLPVQYQISAEGHSNTTFGYLLGTNVRLVLSKRTQLKFGLDYLQTFTDSGYHVTAAGFGPDQEIDRGMQSIAVLNLTWGVVFRLGK